MTPKFKQDIILSYLTGPGVDPAQVFAEGPHAVAVRERLGLETPHRLPHSPLCWSILVVSWTPTEAVGQNTCPRLSAAWAPPQHGAEFQEAAPQGRQVEAVLLFKRQP